MNVARTWITVIDLPLVTMKEDRTRALVTMDTWETALTVIIVMQVTFLVLLSCCFGTFKFKYVIK